MSDQNPPPPGQYPPQGGQPYGYPPQQPQKKSHVARNVIIGVILLGILFCGGCFAIVGFGANEAAKEIDKSIKEEAENDKPKDVQEGKAFTHDGYSAAAGWKVAQDEVFGTTINGLRVTAEESDDTVDGGRTAFFTFRLYKGTDVLAEVTCTSNEMQVGETSKMDCSGDGETVKGWDSIKVADAF